MSSASPVSPDARRPRLPRAARAPLASLVSLAVGAVAVLAACGGDDTTFVTEGSNDLRAACEQRRTWTRAKTVECLECMATAPLPACDCTVKQPFVGLCAQQLKLKLANPECDQTLGVCVNACKPDDCACNEACFASRKTCRARVSALDGCVAEVCDSHCR
jgi:hypothetical protein